MIVGKSPANKKIYRQIGKASCYKVPIPIFGETGTRKDLMARVIHRSNLRSNNVSILCTWAPFRRN